MSLDWKNDLGAPLAVTAVNIVARKFLPNYYDWVVYGVTAAAYVMAATNRGGQFVKNVGIAELPLAADKLYSRITTGAVSGRVQREQRYPAPAFNTEFGGLKLD